MNLGGKRVLVDTCVWVDNYCADHAGGADAKRFLQMAVGQGAELLYAVHATKDVLYVLESEFKRAAWLELGALDEPTAQAAKRAALGCMRNMCDLATTVGADVSDVWLADKYLRIHGDFEDNLVAASARSAGASFIVTSDERLRAQSPIAALLPQDMAKLLREEARG